MGFARNIVYLPKQVRRKEKSDPIYALSDIHGYISLMNLALKWIESDAAGCIFSADIIFCGDYVDYGPSSREVLERLKAGPSHPKHRWHILRGNHEQTMIGAFQDSRVLDLWLNTGGIPTIQSYGYDDPSELDWYKFRPHLKFLRYMRPYIEDEDRIFVHAGLRDLGNGSYDLSRQCEHDLLWIKPRDMDNNWPRRLKKLLVHGHTPRNRGQPGRRVCLDGGAGLPGGGLKVVKFTDQREPVDIKIFKY